MRMPKKLRPERAQLPENRSTSPLWNTLWGSCGQLWKTCIPCGKRSGKAVDIRWKTRVPFRPGKSFFEIPPHFYPVLSPSQAELHPFSGRKPLPLPATLLRRHSRQPGTALQTLCLCEVIIARFFQNLLQSILTKPHHCGIIKVSQKD